MKVIIYFTIYIRFVNDYNSYIVNVIAQQVHVKQWQYISYYYIIFYFMIFKSTQSKPKVHFVCKLYFLNSRSLHQEQNRTHYRLYYLNYKYGTRNKTIKSKHAIFTRRDKVILVMLIYL